MIQSPKSAEGFELRAEDCEIGSVRNGYFDERLWPIRYFVFDIAK